MFDLNMGLRAQCRTLQRRSGLLENWWTASKWTDSFAGLARHLAKAIYITK
jgi:hypothetical protein